MVSIRDTKCPLCFKLFKGEHGLEKHTIDKHIGNNICATNFDLNGQGQFGTTKESDIPKSVCSICKCIVNQKNLEKHTKAVHGTFKSITKKSLADFCPPAESPKKPGNSRYRCHCGVLVSFDTLLDHERRTHADGANLSDILRERYINGYRAAYSDYEPQDRSGSPWVQIVSGGLPGLGKRK